MCVRGFDFSSKFWSMRVRGVEISDSRFWFGCGSLRLEVSGQGPELRVFRQGVSKGGVVRGFMVIQGSRMDRVVVRGSSSFPTGFQVPSHFWFMIIRGSRFGSSIFKVMGSRSGFTGAVWFRFAVSRGQFSFRFDTGRVGLEGLPFGLIRVCSSLLGSDCSVRGRVYPVRFEFLLMCLVRLLVLRLFEVGCFRSGCSRSWVSSFCCCSVFLVLFDCSRLWFGVHDFRIVVLGSLFQVSKVHVDS